LREKGLFQEDPDFSKLVPDEITEKQGKKKARNQPEKKKKS